MRIGRPVVQRVTTRVNPNVSDDMLLARINRIDHEDCGMVMRERADFDPALLAGIIGQRQAECTNRHFNPRPFNPGFRRDADDRRFTTPRFDDRRDDRQINRPRFDGDDRPISAARFDDRRDDRQISRLRFDNRGDDRRMVRLRRDDRGIPAHFASASRFHPDRRFVASRSFAVNRRFAATRSNRPMGRPRP